MAEPLVEVYQEYHGNCDHCGVEIYEPFLLVSDMHEKDKYGNRLFLIIGIPEKDHWHLGTHMNCKKCGGRQLILRLYESTDVTDLVTNEEARNAL